MYRLNRKQIKWIDSKPQPKDFHRFLINGPIDAIMAKYTNGQFVGRLRGIVVTKPVCSLALAIKEAEQIRDEHIQIVGLEPLDERGLGINDTPIQKAAA